MFSCSGQSNRVKSSKDNSQITIEIKMASWQGKLLRTYLRIQRFFRPPTGELDLEKKRDRLEAAGKKFKPVFNIECTHLFVDSVSAEWVIPSSAYKIRLSFTSTAVPITEAPLTLIDL